MSLSNITLTAAVRQNLLSLQGTAELLATTQGRLATGKKVNSALANPTNFFTAAGLDSQGQTLSVSEGGSMRAGDAVAVGQQRTLADRVAGQQSDVSD